MGVLRPIIQALVLPVFDTFKQFPFGRTLAFQLVGHDNSWRKARRFEQLAEKLLGGSLIPMALHQDSEDLPVGIHGPPEIVLLPLNGDHNLIKMPLSVGLGRRRRIYSRRLAQTFYTLCGSLRR